MCKISYELYFIYLFKSFGLLMEDYFFLITLKPSQDITNATMIRIIEIIAKIQFPVKKYPVLENIPYNSAEIVVIIMNSVGIIKNFILFLCSTK